MAMTPSGHFPSSSALLTSSMPRMSPCLNASRRSTTGCLGWRSLLGTLEVIGLGGRAAMSAHVFGVLVSDLGCAGELVLCFPLPLPLSLSDTAGLAFLAWGPATLVFSLLCRLGCGSPPSGEDPFLEPSMFVFFGFAFFAKTCPLEAEFTKLVNRWSKVPGFFLDLWMILFKASTKPDSGSSGMVSGTDSDDFVFPFPLPLLGCSLELPNCNKRDWSPVRRACSLVSVLRRAVTAEPLAPPRNIWFRPVRGKLVRTGLGLEQNLVAGIFR